MSTIFQRETAFTSAPASPTPSSPLLWVPLDEVRQAWASFGAEALSCPALLATGSAFQALSWEASALRHHHLACQAQQCGGLSQDTAASWLDRVVQDLSEAVRDWQGVQLWLERLANSDTQQVHSEPLEQVRILFQQAVSQQQRLWHLLGQVQSEQQRACCPGRVAAPVVPATRQAAGGASHGV